MDRQHLRNGFGLYVCTGTINLLHLSVASTNLFQRVTYAISRDNVLPFSRYFRKLTSTHRMPLHAAFLVAAISIAISTAVIGSSVAFSAITAMSTIATNVSYLFPIIARQTVGAAVFVPAKWNLGRASAVIATISSVWICYLFVVLLLPQVYPVTGVSSPFPPPPRGVQRN